VDFGFSDDQEMLRGSIRDYLRKEAPPSYARAMTDDPTGTTEKVWHGISELGWLGLNIPERFGGSELGLVDLVVLMEETGSVVFPGPLLSSIGLGTQAILAAGTDAQKRSLLPAIAEGRSRATLAVAEDRGVWAEDAISIAARRENGGFVVAGTKLFVPDARSADVIVVAARVDDQPALLALPRDAEGLTVTPMSTMDRTRKLDVVELRGVRADESRLLGGSPLPKGALERLLDVARVLLAAESCGAADATIKLSVDYVQIRKQFDRPIGTFQAIQHKLADMKVALENARSLVYYAAWALETGAEDARLAAAMAKAYASDACTKIAGDAIQVHGGIGFTWEHDLQLYFKRIKSNELTYGDGSANRERIADLLSL
jgi:alkylation response protein AidB-like acyl-CoA dehydrogenase